MSFFYMWGSFAGPIMAGAIYDRTESYTLALWIMLGLLIFATLLVLFLIRPWRIRMTATNQNSQCERDSPSRRSRNGSNPSSG
jgi:hypothetical protein